MKSNLVFGFESPPLQRVQLRSWRVHWALFLENSELESLSTQYGKAAGYSMLYSFVWILNILTSAHAFSEFNKCHFEN